MLSAHHLTELHFDNTEIAFRHKSDLELEKAYWLFKVLSNNTLLQVGKPLINFALKIKLPIQGIIRNTIYKQFCGGESIAGCGPAIAQLGQAGVTTILDYSIESEESEEQFDQTCSEILRTVSYAQQNKLISFCVFKVSGLGRFDLLAKVNTKEALSPAEKSEFAEVYRRIDTICKACYDANVNVLIDAEHSWIQDAIDGIVLNMMELYNKERATVYNTYQLYRIDKLASLQADFAHAQTKNFYLGAKLVRGAYMEIERERAASRSYPSPIQPTKAASDLAYDEAIRFCLDHINRIGMMAGTHNEESVKLLVREMVQRGISPANNHVFFSQLMGMSDNLSFNLAEAGLRVAKYMPYGPVKAVMPYLFRRAQENTAIGSGTVRELDLILKEKARRKAAR